MEDGEEVGPVGCGSSGGGGRGSLVREVCGDGACLEAVEFAGGAVRRLRRRGGVVASWEMVRFDRGGGRPWLHLQVRRIETGG